MRRCTSSTCPSWMRRNIAPSPSTRASRSVLIVRVSVTEGLDVEGPVHAHEVDLFHPQAREPRVERLRTRGLHRAEAAVAAAVVGRAERAAAGVGDRAQARRAVRDHHADVARALALDADAVRGDRGLALIQERADDLE